ncbi:WhiB family transcriptional regulator [Aeromicrobium sp. CF4.19]|uniref:WhiB family transcriptional regulator n=1 Tax=Aeromicrobium sp. CF4.19 TaxID=3373082 RepID=UPI003EE5E3E0
MSSISRLPAPIQESYEWQHQGACNDADPSTFFSPETERGPRRRAREAAAKALCEQCPVVTQCLEHALAVKEPYGVWGGLNATERGHLLRRDVG